jgi:asparagine synthase (glutamine-hydrolysing)
MLQLPPELAFDPMRSRPLLREAMAGLIPDEVRLRPSKSTFDALFHESLAGPDLPVVRELLGDPDAAVGEYVDLATVRTRLLDPEPPSHPTARMHWALYTWRLVTAELWLRSASDADLVPRLGASLRQPDLELVSDR